MLMDRRQLVRSRAADKWKERAMSRKHKVVSIAAVITLLTGVGIASALWSAAGSGAGNAKSITAQSVTVTAATGTADLYPGFTAGDVFFTVVNPNPYPVTFTSMTAGAIVSSNPGACAATNVSVIGATGLNIAVGAGATLTGQSIANVVSMAAGALDGCQNVTFTINLTLTGAQV
jgi:hypothetical protein